MNENREGFFGQTSMGKSQHEMSPDFWTMSRP